MTLPLDVYCGYPSYSFPGEQWGQDDYRAYKLVQALKGNPINGYAWFQHGKNKALRIDEKDASAAFEIFGGWAAGKITEAKIVAPLIVPVPSSGCVEIGGDAKGMKLAAAIAKHLPGATPTSALCWKKPLQKAHEGGSRDPDVLFGNLLVVVELPKRPIVLIDDVTTTGGHLKACARGLRHFEHQVAHAISAAQTVNTHPELMFSIAQRNLEAEEDQGR